MPYPSHLDLRAFLDSHFDEGCTSLTKQDLIACIAAAVEDWEDATGWTPFLIGDSETRIFDALTGDPIWLPVGLQEIETLKVNDVEYDSGLYILRKRNHKQPYSGIDLGRTVRRPIRIEITGTFGYTDTLPASVTAAILSKCAYELYPKLKNLEGEVVREKQGPVEFEYGKASGEDAKYSGQRGTLLKTWDEAVCRYERGV